MNKKSEACLCVFFYDDVVQGIFLGDDDSFGLDVLVDVNKWQCEFSDELPKVEKLTLEDDMELWCEHYCAMREIYNQWKDKKRRVNST